MNYFKLPLANSMVLHQVALGNLCIAGHNYDNNLFFSNINKLKTNDIITITDTFNVLHSYLVFDIYEVEETDLSPINNTTYNQELTLITCNNLNKKRIIVKAKKQDS